MAQVVFDPAEFKMLFPEFADVSDFLLESYFDYATIIISNADSSIIQKIENRKRILYLLTAHIAFLQGSLQPDPSPTPLPVGRVNTASEGSVSVGYGWDVKDSGFNEAWLSQTQYGALVWAMTVAARTMYYVACPTVY